MKFVPCCQHWSNRSGDASTGTELVVTLVWEWKWGDADNVAHGGDS